MKKIYVFLSLFLLLFHSFSSAWATDKIVYKSLEELLSGLSQKETEELDGVFNENKIIDLEQSGKSELSSWVEELNFRLSESLSKLGKHYAQYQIYFIDSSEPQAFLYKYEPKGLEFYRCHVFISTGLISKFSEKIVSKGLSLEEETQDILKGLQGILAREFVEPKQGELIKKDWDFSGDSAERQTQADELTADLMTVNLLKEAELSTDSLLYFLQNLEREKDDQSNAFLDGIVSAFSQSPELEMRINALRARLTHLRLNEGQKKEKQIAINLSQISEELSSLSDQSRNQLLYEKLPEKSDIESMLVKLEQGLDFYNSQDSQGAKWDYERDILFLHEALEKLYEKQLTSTDKEYYFKSTLKLISSPDEWYLNAFNDSQWMKGNDGHVDISSYKMRNYQEGLRKSVFFQKNNFFEEFASLSQEELTNILKKKNFHELLIFFPVRDLEALIPEYLVFIDSLEGEKKVEQLLRLWSSVVKANFHIQTEVKILKKVLDAFQEEGNREHFIPYMYNLERTFQENIFLNERFVRYRPSHPEESKELLKLYFEFFNLGMREGERFTKAIGLDLFLKILYWNLYPKKLLSSYKNNGAFNPLLVLDYFKEPAESENWDNFFDENFQTLKMLSDEGGSSTLSFGNFFFFLQYNNVFEGKDYQKAFYSFIKGLLVKYIGKDGLKLEDWHYYIKFLNDQQMTEVGFVDALLIDIAQKQPKEVKKFILSGKFLASMKEAAFGSSSLTSLHVELLASLKKNGVITSQEALVAIDKQMSFVSEWGGNSFFNSIVDNRFGRSASIELWRFFYDRDDYSEGFFEFLFKNYALSEKAKKLIKEKRIETLGNEFVVIMSSLGIEYHPIYTQRLQYLSGPLIREFKKSVGIESLDIHSLDYKNRFKDNFVQAKDYLKKIFNPDGISIPIQFQSYFNYTALDPLADDFLELIPEGLEYEQYLEIFKTVTAKRANQYSDKFFQKFLYKKVLLENQKETLKDILMFARLRSEKIKVSIAQGYFLERVGNLKEKGHISDKEISALSSSIQKYITNPSRFLDDYLEEISWKLHLNEKQLAVFIEPLKSFNYTRFSVDSVNSLSSLSKLISHLTTSEKINLIKYIQRPSGSIYDAVPRIGILIEKIANPSIGSIHSPFGGLGGGFESGAKAEIDKFEIKLKDANDEERLLYIENIVGSRDYGLWFQGKEMRDKLYHLAEIKGDKKILFESYIKALPEHEHSITLSYLLASVGGEHESELLRTLETFQTPGHKFAQIASIFNIFGEEESEKLAKAKSRAKPPTRYLVYKLLRERLSPAAFDEIQSVDKLLGSGSIKYVAAVTFKNGERAAVYLKRPFTQETNESVLNIAEEWMKYLKEDPEFSNKYDYDYYLKSLREQLEIEINFSLESQKAFDMAAMYEARKPYQGWKFKGIRPIQSKTMSDEVIFYDLVDNVTSFEELPDEQKQYVSQYIIETELDALFRNGDADRHMGNYLFDLENKIIYPLDPGQFYQLENKSILGLGETYFTAQMLYAFSLKDKTKAAQKLFYVFDRLKTNDKPISKNDKALFVENVRNILSGEEGLDKKILSVMSELNQRRIRIPFRISLGVIKGFSIVLKEEYAKVAGKEFVEERLEKEIKKIIIGHLPAKAIEQVSSFFCNEKFSSKK